MPITVHRTRGDLAQRLKTAARRRQHQDLELVAVGEMPTEDAIEEHL